MKPMHNDIGDNDESDESHRQEEEIKFGELYDLVYRMPDVISHSGGVITELYQTFCRDLARNLFPAHGFE